MRPRAATLESLHTAALGLWLGAIVVSAANAAMIFPRMHTLDPRLPAYQSYTGPHWSLAAGGSANDLFRVAGIVSLLCAVLVVGSFAGLVATRSLTKPALLLRTPLLIAIAAGFILSTIVAQRIGSELALYDAAARAGENAAAEQHRGAIASVHPLSTQTLGATAALLLVGIAASLVSTARSRSPEPR